MANELRDSFERFGHTFLYRRLRGISGDGRFHRASVTLQKIEEAHARVP